MHRDVMGREGLYAVAKWLLRAAISMQVEHCNLRSSVSNDGSCVGRQLSPCLPV